MDDEDNDNIAHHSINIDGQFFSYNIISYSCNDL